MTKITYRQLLKHIVTAGDSVVEATFTKKDGTPRDIRFRRNVATDVLSNPNNLPNDSSKRIRRGSVMTVKEVKVDGTEKWSSVNLKTVTRFRANNKEFFISE